MESKVVFASVGASTAPLTTVPVFIREPERFKVG
jgi:hypothetical protein